LLSLSFFQENIAACLRPEELPETLERLNKQCSLVNQGSALFDNGKLQDFFTEASVLFALFGSAALEGRALCYLAMAHARMNQRESVRECVAKVNKIIDSLIAQHEHNKASELREELLPLAQIFDETAETTPLPENAALFAEMNSAIQLFRAGEEEQGLQRLKEILHHSSLLSLDSKQGCYGVILANLLELKAVRGCQVKKVDRKMKGALDTDESPLSKAKLLLVHAKVATEATAFRGAQDSIDVAEGLIWDVSDKEATELGIVVALRKSFLSFKLGNPLAAMRKAKDAEERATNAENSILRYEANFLQGEILAKDGETDAAMCCFREAEEIAIQAAYRRGAVEAERRLVTQYAKACPREFLEQDKNLDLPEATAIACMGIGNYAKAIQEFLKYEAGKPAMRVEERTTLHASIAQCYWCLEDIEQAAKEFSVAIQFGEQTLQGAKADDAWYQTFFTKELASIYKCLAAVLVQKGNTHEALRMCDRARGRASAELLAQKQQQWEIFQHVDPCDDPRELAQKRETTILFYAILPVVKSEEKEAAIKSGAFSPSVLDWRLCIWVVQPVLESPIRFHSGMLLSEALQGESLSDYMHAFRGHLGIPENHPKRGDQFEFDASEARNQERDPTLTRNGLREKLFKRPANQQETQSSRLLKLYTLLIEPIKDLLPTAEEDLVTIVPEQELYLVPFAALKDSKNNYLVESHSLSMAPSLALLCQLPPPLRAFNPEKCVVVGDPINRRWGSLPGAIAEANGVAGALHTKPLVGKDAEWHLVKPYVHESELFHFAGHGLCYAVNSKQDFRTSTGALVLGVAGDEDPFFGLLFSYELECVRLARGALVVLSGCDTAIGQLNSDGMAGLARVFLTCNASTVLVSLWPLYDDKAADIFLVFYEEFLENGRSAAAALRVAMKKLLMNFREEPRFWAPFVVLGNV